MPFCTEAENLAEMLDLIEKINICSAMTDPKLTKMPGNFKMPKINIAKALKEIVDDEGFLPVDVSESVNCNMTRADVLQFWTDISKKAVHNEKNFYFITVDNVATVEVILTMMDFVQGTDVSNMARSFTHVIAWNKDNYAFAKNVNSKSSLRQALNSILLVDAECPVCFEPVNEGDHWLNSTTLFVCNHFICRTCWAENKLKECPVCRETGTYTSGLSAKKSRRRGRRAR